MTAINLFSGTFAMLNYTASIFQVSGSDLDPHISAIVIAAIQIVGVYGSTSLVDRVGRKTLLTFSTCGAFVGLASLGTYSYLTNEVGMDLSHLNWVPLISFSTFMFISCFGIVPLPFIVLTEILPAKVHAHAKIDSILIRSRRFDATFFLSIGTSSRANAVYAVEQYICIHLAENVSAAHELGRIVWCCMDLFGRLFVRNIL